MMMVMMTTIMMTMMMMACSYCMMGYWCLVVTLRGNIVVEVFERPLFPYRQVERLALETSLEAEDGDPSNHRGIVWNQ
jgi:hypothetical protein